MGGGEGGNRSARRKSLMTSSIPGAVKSGGTFVAPCQAAGDTGSAPVLVELVPAHPEWVRQQI